MFRPATWAADPGEPAPGVAAVEVFLDDLFNDRTKEAVFALKTLLIFRDKPLEIMEEHPVEDGSLRMTRAIDSRHTGSELSRNAPGKSPGRNREAG